MKTLLLTLSLFLAAPALPLAYGADPAAEEFRAAFSRAYAKISHELPELTAELLPLRLAEVERSATVEGSDEILVVDAGEGSQESVAVNEPATQRVLINRARWAAIPSELTKEAVALHEVLSLAGAERTGAYPYSSRYLAKFGGRADAAYLIAGRDPGRPAWKSRRMSCEKRFDYLDRRTGRVHKDSAFGLSAIHGWKIRGKTYTLQWIFGDEVEHIQTVIPFTQSVHETIGKDGAGHVMRIEDRMVIRSVNEYFFLRKSPEVFVEEEESATTKRYYWDKNRRGKLREKGVLTELGDGSLRFVNDNLAPHPDKDTKTLVSRSACVVKQLPEGEWAAITGEPGILRSLENLSELAKRANEAVLKAGFRAGGGPTPEEKAFLAAWDALYEAEIRKVAAVPYIPGKGLRGSVLAAGRKPKPVPAEIMKRTVREVEEDRKRLARQGKPHPSEKLVVKAASPMVKPAKPRASAANRASAKCPIATEPTFIPAPDGGSPILRMEGQSLCLDAPSRRMLEIMHNYKKIRGRNPPAQVYDLSGE